MDGKIGYRIFRTWDHSTNWIENVPGQQEYGVANYYAKDPDWFATEYETMVDWCAAHGVDAICVAGLLRDRHVDFWMEGYPAQDAGLIAAKRVCAYGREKGVRVCLEAGVFSHGGVYFRGVSERSLETFLERHPEARRMDASGRPVVRRFAPPMGHLSFGEGDPAHPLMRRFACDSVDWVFSAIPGLGGIRFMDDPGELQDELVKIVRARDPEALVLGGHPGAGVLDVRHTDAGSQWGGVRGALALEDIRALCRSAAGGRADGVSLWAEVSPHRANAEFNYLALAFFSADPARTAEDFVRTEMAPRLGGEAAAARYLALAATADDPRGIPAAAREIAVLAARQTDEAALSRWFSLAEFLQGLRWQAEEREELS